MTVKINNKDLYEAWLSVKQDGLLVDREDDLVSAVYDFLEYVDDDAPIGQVKLVVDAIFDGKVVEFVEQKYEIPLPNLVTSDGAQQYLSRRPLGSYFASRKMNVVCSEFTELEVNTQVPKIYRQFAKKVED